LSGRNFTSLISTVYVDPGELYRSQILNTPDDLPSQANPRSKQNSFGHFESELYVHGYTLQSPKGNIRSEYPYYSRIFPGGGSTCWNPSFTPVIVSLFSQGTMFRTING